MTLIEALMSAQTEKQAQAVLSSEETNALVATSRQLENDEFHFLRLAFRRGIPA